MEQCTEIIFDYDKKRQIYKVQVEDTEPISPTPVVCP